mmetsp:Transcript_21895/g.44979  ORF Transcript_21895/g.44979 Transcript_21895/m.44979 type:complete len:238 (-) Transcript_21895:1-714(-)
MLQLRSAVHECLPHGFRDGLAILADVLLGGAFERDLGRHNAHENANLVFLRVDLVGSPLDFAVRDSCRHVTPWLEQQRNSVREPVHRDAIFCCCAPQGDPALHHKRVAFVGGGFRHGVGGHEYRVHLFLDAEPEVVLSRGAQALAVGGLEQGHVSESLREGHHLGAGGRDSLGGVFLCPRAQLCHDACRHRLVHPLQLGGQEACKRVHARFLQELAHQHVVDARRVELDLCRQVGDG